VQTAFSAEISQPALLKDSIGELLPHIILA
jgi:hypothetical protein